MSSFEERLSKGLGRLDEGWEDEGFVDPKIDNPSPDEDAKTTMKSILLGNKPTDREDLDNLVQWLRSLGASE